MASKRLKQIEEAKLNESFKIALNSEVETLLNDVKVEFSKDRELIKELLLKWALSGNEEIKENLQIAYEAYLLKAYKLSRNKAKERWTSFLEKVLPIIIKIVKIVVLP